MAIGFKYTKSRTFYMYISTLWLKQMTLAFINYHNIIITLYIRTTNLIFAIRCGFVLIHKVISERRNLFPPAKFSARSTSDL